MSSPATAEHFIQVVQMDCYFDLTAPDNEAEALATPSLMPPGWDDFIPAYKRGWHVLQSQEQGSLAIDEVNLAFDRRHPGFQHLGGNPLTVNCWVKNGGSAPRVTDVFIYMYAFDLRYGMRSAIPLPFRKMIWNSYGLLPGTPLIDVPSTMPLTYPGPISFVTTGGTEQQRETMQGLQCFSLAVFQFPEDLPEKFGIDVSVFLKLNGRRFGNDPELDVDMGGGD